MTSDPSDHQPDPEDQTGDLPTRPPSQARPGQDPAGVDDTGGPTDPEHPSG